MNVCTNDLIVCIDFTILFIAEFLKDWTTLAMLAVLLVLLLKLRAEQQKAREAAYARQMTAYDEKRKQEWKKKIIWEVEDDKWVERRES